MMQRFFVISGCLLMLLVSVAGAQDGQRKGLGRGQGGGGFGGMMGRGGGSLLIMQMEEVQKELGFTDEQQKAIGELIRENVPQFGRGGGGGGGGGANFDPAEAQKRRAEMEKNLTAGFAKILKPEQLERFQQLRVQRDGIGAIARAEISEKLGITAEQKEKIEKIQADARAASAGGGQNFFDLSEEQRQELMTKMNEQRKKTEADLLAVLTDAQKETLTSIKGKEFKFPEGGRGGGRPGGGGGGGERKRPASKKAI